AARSRRTGCDWKWPVATSLTTSGRSWASLLSSTCTSTRSTARWLRACTGATCSVRVSLSDIAVLGETLGPLFCAHKLLAGNITGGKPMAIGVSQDGHEPIVFIMNPSRIQPLHLRFIYQNT